MSTYSERIEERRRNNLLIVEILSGYTTRQLFADYRQTIKHLNEVREHANNGGNYYLGDKIQFVLGDANRSHRQIVAEIEKRNLKTEDIKNVPALIKFKGWHQIEAEKKSKEAADNAERELKEAKAQQDKNTAEIKPGIDAIKAFATFQLNYKHDFIEVAFAGGMINHLRSKFNNIHSNYGAKAAMIMFWAELDFENRDLLAKYIINQNIK